MRVETYNGMATHMADDFETDGPEFTRETDKGIIPIRKTDEEIIAILPKEGGWLPLSDWKRINISLNKAGRTFKDEDDEEMTWEPLGKNVIEHLGSLENVIIKTIRKTTIITKIIVLVREKRPGDKAERQYEQGFEYTPPKLV